MPDRTTADFAITRGAVYLFRLHQPERAATDHP